MIFRRVSLIHVCASLERYKQVVIKLFDLGIDFDDVVICCKIISFRGIPIREHIVVRIGKQRIILVVYVYSLNYFAVQKKKRLRIQGIPTVNSRVSAQAIFRVGLRCGSIEFALYPIVAEFSAAGSVSGIFTARGRIGGFKIAFYSRQIFDFEYVDRHSIPKIIDGNFYFC